MLEPTELTPVESSNIAAIGQSSPNAEDQTVTLTIQFTNGGVYDYADVPIELVGDFMTAESVGKFFFSDIRTQFDGVKRVTEPKEEEQSE